MPTVNAEILRILKDKDRGIRSGIESMLEILEELRSQVIDELGRAALGSWDAYQLKQMKEAIERQTANFESAAKREMGDRLNDMWNEGRNLIDAPFAQAGEVWTGFNIATSTLNKMEEFAVRKITGLSEAAYGRIEAELTLGVLGGKTPQEVAKAIGMNLDDPSIFGSIARRAEAITKTEMGRVFSAAAEERMEEAAEHVDGLEKQWRHVGHPKVPRETHLAADGQHVPVDEPFDIGGMMMMYPRDPAAAIEETINCGCDHVPYHARWA